MYELCVCILTKFCFLSRLHLKINNGCAVIPFKSISHLVSQTTSILANAPTDPFHSDFRTSDTVYPSRSLPICWREKGEQDENGWWMWISARLKRVCFSVLCTHPLSRTHRYRIYYTSASDGTEYYFILQFLKRKSILSVTHAKLKTIKKRFLWV